MIFSGNVESGDSISKYDGDRRGSLNGSKNNRNNRNKKLLRRRSSGGPETFTPRSRTAEPSSALLTRRRGSLPIEVLASFSGVI